jgi:hypothetical protein
VSNIGNAKVTKINERNTKENTFFYFHVKGLELVRFAPLGQRTSAKPMLQSRLYFYFSFTCHLPYASIACRKG